MVALPKRKRSERRESYHARKIRGELVKTFEAELKVMVRDPLENLMREEQARYSEARPTCANGYYARDLLTLARPLEKLKVSRVREGDCRPNILPYRRRASLELSEAILTLPFMPNGITLAVERDVMRGHQGSHRAGNIPLPLAGGREGGRTHPHPDLPPSRGKERGGKAFPHQGGRKRGNASFKSPRKR